MRTDLRFWLERFFREYLLQQRNVSAATIGAYRDTFRLFLQFWRGRHRRTPSVLLVEALTADVVIGFLYGGRGKLDR